MRKEHVIALGAGLGLSLAAVGCSSDGDGTGSEVATTSAPLQCDSGSYVAFDSANHLNQDLRLAAHAEMNTLMKDAASAMDAGDASAASDMFGAATTIYMEESESASLRVKVMGRLDEHVAGDPVEGERLDATIVKWLEFGSGAQDPLEATVARQWVDKTMTEFFFLSVHHELLAGTRKNWDEAFGYFGSGPDNDEADFRGLASTAFKRDSNNGTSLEPEIFNGLVDGSCEVARALDEAEAEEIDIAGTAVEPIVVDIDLAMQQVLAYSVGHEAFEMIELLEADTVDTDEITIKAAELIPFFVPIERIMNDKGGDSAERAAEIRSIVDAMPVSDPDQMDVGDTSWIDGLGEGPARIIELLEVEYDIEIQG
ncbi:MAG: hypothetical protein OEZ06_08445 [Myxococcales bacterium]|nr:hypothetical protein [Myxococcales bacterium]